MYTCRESTWTYLHVDLRYLVSQHRVPEFDSGLIGPVML